MTDTFRILDDSLGLKNPPQAACPGLANQADSWTNKLAAIPGVTVVAHAAGSSCLVEIAIVADSLMFPTVQPAATDKFIIGGGVNDMQRYDTPAKREAYRGARTEMISRLSCPARLNALSSAITYVGAWNTIGAVTWGQLRSTNNPAAGGEKILIPPAAGVRGEAIWLHSYAVDTTLAWNTVVTIDGAVRQPLHPWNCGIPGLNTGSNISGPMSHCYAGLTPGINHDIVIENVAGFLYFTGVSGSEQTTNPHIYVVTPARQFQPGVDANGAIAAACRQIDIDTASEFVGRGRNVHLVDFGPDIVLADMATDLIHWIASGHLKKFNRVNAAIYPPITGSKIYGQVYRLDGDPGAQWYAENLDGSNGKQIS